MNINTVTHVAGPVVTIGSRSVQRCALCGEKLRDNRNEAAPVRPDGKPDEFVSWAERALVRFEDNHQTLIGDFVGIAELPEDFCIELVE